MTGSAAYHEWQEDAPGACLAMDACRTAVGEF
jgi:hypothetical protein